jgi:hypothetical protein
MAGRWPGREFRYELLGGVVVLVKDVGTHWACRSEQYPGCEVRGQTRQEAVGAFVLEYASRQVVEERLVI